MALKDWLEFANTRSDHPHFAKLRVRFSELEPVIKMMGAAEALVCLQTINADLQTLTDHGLPDDETRLRLAESLIVLDTLLDKSARQSITRHSHTQQLRLVDNALQILPLPEISPLLRGLSNVLTQLQLTARQGRADDASATSAEEYVATLLVSLDYYLGCVLQPQAAASQLLLDAEQALDCALTELNSNDSSPASKAISTDSEQRVSDLLPHMDQIGSSIKCR